MQHSFFLDIFLMILGVLGFSLASYIYHCKHKAKPLVCPLRASCNLVTLSDYSKFFGLPVERLGMVYYIAVVLFHAVVVIDPILLTPATFLSALLASTAAFLFSLYLIIVQAFVLKEWCTWCVVSALLCAVIFITTSGLAF